MKNKKIIRKFTVLLAALVIMCGFSVTAYAGGGDESDDTPTPVTEETPAPETEPEETTGGYEPQPLTPDGNMSLVDDITVKRPATSSLSPSLPKVATIFTSSLTAPRTGKIPSISLTKWTKRI